MHTCDHYREMLWDLVYDLLEEPETEAARGHLETCDACRTVLSAVQADADTLAEVARLNVEIPLFVAPVDEPETIPFKKPEKQPAGIRTRWPWIGVAAAVLIAAVPYGYYRHQLGQHQAAVRAAGERTVAVHEQRAELRNQINADQVAFDKEARSKHMRVQVVGPASIARDASPEYRILATAPNGDPVPANLIARVRNKGGKPLFEKELSGTGEMLVSLPANGFAGDDANVLEVARLDNNQDLFRAVLTPAKTTYLTHVVMDRPGYSAGEPVYFRSFTFDSMTRKPAAEPFHVVYELQAPNGRVEAFLDGLTQKEGVGAGQFMPRMNGLYRLTVSELKNRFAPVTRDFRVGKPSVAADVTVELLPEGGALVAGIRNRVFFLARDGRGRPVEIVGQIVDNRDRPVLEVRSGTADSSLPWAKGLGFFTITPQAGEKYLLALSTPALRDQPKQALPPVLNRGVGLSVPNCVVGDDLRLRARLHVPGTEPEDVAVCVFERDRLVAHQNLSARPGLNEVSFSIPGGCCGTLRVVVYGMHAGQPERIAERLVYRQPAERFDLALQADRQSYSPGDRLALQVKSLTEMGLSEDCRIGISMVSVSEAEHTSGVSLPVFAHLASCFRQLDLGYPNQLPNVREGKVVAALDVLLGIQGWQAPVRSSGNQMFAIARPESRAQDIQRSEIVFLDNGERIRNSFEADRKSWIDQHAGLVTRDQQLAEDEKASSREARLALANLADFEDRTQATLRLGRSLFLAGLLSAGCVFLVLGVVRLARGLETSRAYLAPAMTALGICMVVFLLPTSSSLSTSEPATPLGSVSNAIAGVGKVMPVATGNRHPLVVRVKVNDVTVPKATQPLVKGPPRALPLESFVATNQGPIPNTVLWQPHELAANGMAQFGIDLPKKPGKYRVVVEAISISGRLGFAETELIVK